jgi:hypothetical protein
MTTPGAALALTYLMPFRSDRDEVDPELTTYLRRVAASVGEVLVVDNSGPEIVERHRASFGSSIRVLEPETPTLMGKVGNVITGVEHALHEHVVIADDDVRYETDQLARVVALLTHADVVRPQNYFEPRPWHARFDTARILLNRITGGDWPGTLAVRRTSFLATRGYAGDVMFENLELVRTLQASGGSHRLALDLLVARRPPTTSHFWRQQVRQAYDEFARPTRLVISLSLLPTAVIALATGRTRLVASAAIAAIGGAEWGRRRAGGRAAFPASSSLLAPPWLLWRSACSWAALAARARGGVRYRGVRIAKAATSTDELERRLARQLSS